MFSTLIVRVRTVGVSDGATASGPKDALTVPLSVPSEALSTL